MIFVILFYLLFGIYEMLAFLHNGNRKEMFIYLVFLVGGLIISLLISINVNLPGPSRVIKQVVLYIIGK